METLAVAGPFAQLFFFLATHAACVVAGVVWARRKGQAYLDLKAQELLALRDTLQARVERVPAKVDGALDQVKAEVELGLDKITEAVKKLKQ